MSKSITSDTNPVPLYGSIIEGVLELNALPLSVLQDGLRHVDVELGEYKELWKVESSVITKYQIMDFIAELVPILALYVPLSTYELTPGKLIVTKLTVF